jgi:hypothetical protein
MGVMLELVLTLNFDQNKVHQKMVLSIHCIHKDRRRSKLKKIKFVLIARINITAS